VRTTHGARAHAVLRARAGRRPAVCLARPATIGPTPGVHRTVGRCNSAGDADLAWRTSRAVTEVPRGSAAIFGAFFRQPTATNSEDQGPTGGLGWDGRADSAHEQAAAPLLSPFEMANADIGSVVARLQSSPAAGRMREAFGAASLTSPSAHGMASCWRWKCSSQNPADFYPYNSKYDAFLARPGHAGCRRTARPGSVQRRRQRQLRALPPERDQTRRLPAVHGRGFRCRRRSSKHGDSGQCVAAWRDLGLCGPLRIDIEETVLSMRPVSRSITSQRGAARVFFHNGVYSRLEDAVRFTRCATRCRVAFYRRDRGAWVQKFDDLPAPYWVT